MKQYKGSDSPGVIAMIFDIKTIDEGVESMVNLVWTGDWQSLNYFFFYYDFILTSHFNKDEISSVKPNPEMAPDDDRYRRKLDDLQKHVPFIEAMLKHLRSTKKKSRQVQLTKMESLYTMITDTRRK